MKCKFLIVISASLFMACSGDHSTHIVRDTGDNRYKTDTEKIERTSIDTSKVSTKPGDASLDNSGSGGTKMAKDSSKK